MPSSCPKLRPLTVPNSNVGQGRVSRSSPRCKFDRAGSGSIQSYGLLDGRPPEEVEALAKGGSARPSASRGSACSAAYRCVAPPEGRHQLPGQDSVSPKSNSYRGIETNRESPAHTLPTDLPAVPPGLAEVVAAWEALPASIRAEILATVRAVTPTTNTASVDG
jgi:hypothetical protein